MSGWYGSMDVHICIYRERERARARGTQPHRHTDTHTHTHMQESLTGKASLAFGISSFVVLFYVPLLLGA